MWTYIKQNDFFKSLNVLNNSSIDKCNDNDNHN